MQIRTWFSWGLAAWALVTGLVVGAADHLWMTVALPLMLLTLFPMLFLGFVWSGAVAAAWIPAWPVGVRAPLAACAGFWLHFGVLYTVGVGAHWPLASALEPFAFTAPRQWFVLCALAGVASAAMVLQARPSNAARGLPSS